MVLMCAGRRFFGCISARTCIDMCVILVARHVIQERHFYSFACKQRKHDRKESTHFTQALQCSKYVNIGCESSIK